MIGVNNKKFTTILVLGLLPRDTFHVTLQLGLVLLGDPVGTYYRWHSPQLP